MKRYKTIFVTERGLRHQQAALSAAPPELDITMLRQPDKATMLTHLADAEYFVSERTGMIDADMIQAAPRLKLIQRLGSLTYDIDTAAAQAAGVAVCYWPIGTVIRVAEHLVLQMLALSKKLGEAQAIALAASTEWGPSRRTDEDTFAYNWSNREDVEGLWQRTIGIMGFGEIGAELARRLQGWDCTVLYHKRRRLPLAVEQELGLTYVDSAALFSQSDYIANLLPYFKETDMLINADFLAKMKDGAALVSCGSGSVIDEAAVAAAVQSGKLSGAALDTFEWEPIKADNPLLALAKQGYNVLLTPHIAAGSIAAAAQERLGDYTNLVNHINARPLKYKVV
jgi:phosphoglycerate dehydrogenase-like enzyme